jgi:hypothetical protein
VAPPPTQLQVDQGSDWSATLTIMQNGTPLDLTGYSAHMQIRSQPGGTVYADLSNASGGITLGGTAGTVYLRLTNAQTAALPAAPGAAPVYDLKLTDPNGLVSFVLDGSITVRAQVTE